MAGELPTFDFGSESDNKKNEKGKKDTRKSSVSSALGNLIRPEQRETYSQVPARERELGGLLFGEQVVREGSSESKPRKKKKAKTLETSAVLPSDRPDSIPTTPQTLYNQPEAAVPAATESDLGSRNESQLDDDPQDEKQDYKKWAESAQEFELPEGAEYGGETVIYLHDSKPVIEQRAEGGGQDSARERPLQEATTSPIGTERASEAVFMPPVVLPNLEAPVVDNSPGEYFPPTEALAPAPFGEPYAPVTELTDDLPRVSPTAEYVNVNPTPGLNEAWNPAEAYRRAQYGNTPRYGYQPAEQGVTAKELDDAVYQATKAGQSRGVVAGLFAGGLYEHFKHRRRERKTEQRFSEQSKQLDKAREDSHFYFTEQTRQQAESKRQLEATERRSASLERQMYAYKEQGEQTTAQIAELQGERQKLAAQEIARQATLEAGENIAIPREHALQSSAWHNIEIDKRTGRPVETPTFAYGNEYYRERAHENLPGDQQSAAAGGAALTGAGATGTGDQSGTGPLSSTPYIPSATTQGPPASRKKRMGGVMRGQRTNSSTTGPLWPYLVALVVILFCLIVLLH